MRIAEIRSIRVTDCLGEEVTVSLGRCRCAFRCGYGIRLNGNVITTESFDALLADARRERRVGGCDGNWPYVVEQLAAEGAFVGARWPR